MKNKRKFVPIMLILLLCLNIVLPQTTAFAEETVAEVVVPKEFGQDTSESVEDEVEPIPETTLDAPKESVNHNEVDSIESKLDEVKSDSTGHEIEQLTRANTYSSELNQSGFVDNFTIDPKELKYGERAKITVNFSDKSGNNMKSGDTLTLSLPTELEGFVGTIPLNDQSGQNFGSCDVSQTHVVCTFNDTVERLNNIRGSFFFNIQAGIVESDERREVPTNLGTNLSTQIVYISNPAGGTEPGVFFYKTGDMQPSNPTEVRWFLNANQKKEWLGNDIVIKDILQSGQTLNRDSFNITISGVGTISLEEFHSQGYGEIKFGDESSFEVRIYQGKGNQTSFSIAYTSKITEEGKSQEFFKNGYDINYQVLHGDVQNQSDVFEVKNISSGGEAEGDLPPKGTLRILKYVNNDEELMLAGVTFKVFTESGTQIGKEYTTNADGIVEISNLEPGKYYVQEISAPEFIVFDANKKFYFAIEKNAEKGIKIPINNNVKTTDISITKTWVNAGKEHPTIKINLLNGSKVIDSVTLKNGKVNHTFEKLPKYDAKGTLIDYKVEEAEVPEGFQSTVTGNAKDGFEIQNKKIEEWKGAIKVLKTVEVKGISGYSLPLNLFIDRGLISETKASSKLKSLDLYGFEAMDSTNPFSPKNFTFTLTGENYTKTITTDEWGVALFDDLAAGIYTLTEEFRTDYENGIPIAGQIIVLSKDTATEYNVKDIQVVNMYSPKIVSVVGTKTWKDGDSKDRPDSIVVELLRNGEKVNEVKVTVETNWNYSFAELGKYDEKGVAYKYTVKEHTVPEGYTSTVEGFEITNTLIPEETEVQVTIEGTKTWQDDNSTIRPTSIVVELFQNGVKIKDVTVTVADDWKYSFSNLVRYDAAGKEYSYTVKEQPVPGYKTVVDGYNITNIINPVIPIEPGPGPGPDPDPNPNPNPDPNPDPDPDPNPNPNPNPVYPVTPVTPVNPVNPVNPVDPTTPVNPVEPTNPVNPTEPDDQENVDTPIGLVDPDDPENPENLPTLTTSTDPVIEPIKLKQVVKPITGGVLPKTGEEQSAYMMIVGFVLIALGSLLIVRRKRSTKLVNSC